MDPVLFVRQAASSSRWSSSELKIYIVSDQAHGRGYGPPEEIVQAESRAEGNA
jgi:hypothetical protein